ncbi:hypothetical protein [Mycolicibacterium phlei]|uniref:Uncharacterized protein n=1 Tax=Mycolicibacterium phlei DSM 43239 = CCUG 21000 TaxID=1226750 RepID=A0A5N5UVQ4_MYCPH|nr:hypothetical protein [Mycolicibacterium phlei]KAB7753675.1 hypothetical protein MPHL21000_18140 [Mycolicibacterium phlei DSM 43239 = CCUG 21000]KXW63172.1 hypothetical protein MPHL43070_23900 [Mycolicibacterium phlei DSM 43070]KXW64892.1 hypothetical protein MPHL43072_25245 [Mycolicibacterium phlei DSM 43072]KXW66806.1 hypothetical protein MPHL43239_07455 [Mycolicibacterium phlei DSM 43239 = CCUG 21000]
MLDWTNDDHQYEHLHADAANGGRVLVLALIRSSSASRSGTCTAG